MTIFYTGSGTFLCFFFVHCLCSTSLNAIQLKSWREFGKLFVRKRGLKCTFVFGVAESNYEVWFFSRESSLWNDSFPNRQNFKFWILRHFTAISDSKLPFFLSIYYPYTEKQRFESRMAWKQRFNSKLMGIFYDYFHFG